MDRPTTPSPRPGPGGGSLLGLLTLAALLAFPTPAPAAPGALLEVTFGPHETGWLAVDTLEVRLDGQELPVRRPAPDDPMGAPLYSGAVAPGPHRVEMTALLRGDSDLFTYVQDYRFTMRGHLDVTAPVGHVVGVHGSVKANGGATTAWADRYTLALAAAPYASDRAAAVEAPAPPPPDIPAAAPVVLAPPPAPPPDTSCALAPVRFAFNRSALTPPARQAVDQFAACLARGSSPVRIDGHCDIRGSDAYNRALGQRRADAVARRLEADGVAPGRLSTHSYGEDRPLCGEPTEACHARNRRVEAAVGE